MSLEKLPLEMAVKVLNFLGFTSTKVHILTQTEVSRSASRS